MHKAFILCGLLLAVRSAPAQSARPNLTPARVLPELLQIEADIARANRDCDYRYFARVEATEFIFTDAAGRVTTRSEDLAGESGCRKSTALAVIDEPRLQLHGNVAVLSARSSIERADKTGAMVSRRSRFTDVFVWRADRWQLVAGHSSNIPPAASAEVR
jgi:ketosteroid isomerase-like protein